MISDEMFLGKNIAFFAIFHRQSATRFLAGRKQSVLPNQVGVGGERKERLFAPRCEARGDIIPKAATNSHFAWA